MYPIKKTSPLAVGLQGLAGFAQGFVKQKNVEEEKKEQERIRKENIEFQRQMAEESRAWQQENMNYDRAWDMYMQVLNMTKDIGPDAPEELRQAAEAGRIELLNAIKNKDWDTATAVYANFNSALPKIQEYSVSRKEQERRKEIADQMRFDAIKSNDPFMVSVADKYEKTGEIPEGVFNNRGTYILALKDPRASAQVLEEAYDESGALKPGYEWVESVKGILETNANAWKEQQKEEEANKLSAELGNAVKFMAQSGIRDPELQARAAEAEASGDPEQIRNVLYEAYDAISKDVNTDQGMQVFSNVAKIYAEAGVPMPDDIKTLADENPAEAYRRAVNDTIYAADDDTVIRSVENQLPILEEYASEIPGASEAISKFISAPNRKEKAAAARELAPLVSKAIDKASQYASEDRLLKRYSNANAALHDAITTGNTKVITGLQANGMIDGATASNAIKLIEMKKALNDVEGGGQMFKLVADFSPIVPGEDGNVRLLSPSELENAIQERQQQYAELLANAGITGAAADAALASLRHAMTTAWFEAKKDLGREMRANEQLELQRKQYALNEKRFALELGGGNGTGGGASPSEIRLRAKAAMDAAQEAGKGLRCYMKDALGNYSWVDTTSSACAPIYRDWAENYKLLQDLSAVGKTGKDKAGGGASEGGTTGASPGIVPPGTRTQSKELIPGVPESSVPKQYRDEVASMYDLVTSGKNDMVNIALNDLEKLGDSEEDVEKAREIISNLASLLNVKPDSLAIAMGAAIEQRKKKDSPNQVEFNAYIKPGKITPEQITRVAPALKVVSEEAGMPADAALALMWLETDRTLDPAVNSKGLFQIVGHGDMSKLPPEKQAEVYAKTYLEGNPDLKQAIEKYRSGEIPFGRLYLAHFLPKYWDAPEDTRIPDRFIKTNPLFKDDPTVGGVIRKANQYYAEIMEARE